MVISHVSVIAWVFLKIKLEIEKHDMRNYGIATITRIVSVKVKTFYQERKYDGKQKYFMINVYPYAYCTPFMVKTRAGGTC